MSGIKHEWNGSVLTVTSDSGTSAADLKGPKGDTGPRGPQGPAGVIYDAAGQLVLDLAPYATVEDVQAMLGNVDVDMSDYLTKDEVVSTYATKNYVTAEVAKAQLEGAGIDTSGFATKDDLANIEIDTSDFATKEDIADIIANVETMEVDIDNKTIIRDSEGRLKSAIGGYSNNGGGVNYSIDGIYYTSYGGWNGWQTTILGNIGKPWAPGCLYRVKMTFADGDSITFDAEFQLVPDKWDPSKLSLEMLQSYEEVLYDTQNHISCLYVELDGDFYYTPKAADVYENFNELKDKWICVAVSIYAEGFVPIDGNFIPVDGTTVYLNSDGKLACNVQVGEDGDVDLSNFYTKSEVDKKIADVADSAAGPELSNYYTKAEIDALLANATIPSSEEVSY